MAQKGMKFSQPGAQDIHVDTALSNVSVGYRNSGYIADLIFPFVEVLKQSDDLYTWTKDFWFRNNVQKRTPNDTYPEGGLEVSTQKFFADIYHLAFPIADEDVANQDEVIELEITGSEWLADQFMLNREAKVVADFFKTGVWETDKTLTGGDRWDDFANSDPEAEVRLMSRTMQKSTGTKGNVLTIGPEVRDKLAEHPLFLEKYKYTSVSLLDDTQIASVLKIPKIMVGEAVANTAQEGATFSGEFMWGKSALLLQVADRPGRRVPSAGYTFVWTMVDGADLIVQVTNVRDELRDRNVLRGKHAFDQKAVAVDLGSFLATVIS